MIDIETGAFMALNFDLAYKIPVHGKILVVVTKKTAEFVKSCRWISGLFFFGIVLMVMVPVVGSGGIRGSIGGKILGMDTPVVFMAIAAGALAGCFGIALGSEFILRQICMHGSLPADIGAFVCSRP
jgi:membrane protease YdiL (CAAX protease family)